MAKIAKARFVRTTQVTPPSGDSRYPPAVSRVAKTANISKATFSILHDEQLKIMLSYDVISEEKVEEYLAGLEETGVDNQEKYLPVPATYIINQKGVIEFVYFDPNYRVRVPIDQLLGHL